MASRTSILETVKNVASANPTIPAKSTISSFEKFFFDIRSGFRNHPFLSLIGMIIAGFGGMWLVKRRRRGGRGLGYFRLDEKEGLLGGLGGAGANGKAD